jgi:hypothetical protein
VGLTHGDGVFDVNLPPRVTGEATAVCDILQDGAIWVLCLAVHNREGELEGYVRVGCECDVVLFTPADFDARERVPGLCTDEETC